MKFSILYFGIIFSSGAFAQIEAPTINAQILPQAKIVEVGCKTPYHKDHDWSLAGTVEVVSSEGQHIKMNMAVSRFSDEKKEAAKLCKTMKMMKNSGKSFDLIFTEAADFGETENIRLDIKGGANLSGLNPLYNG